VERAEFPALLRNIFIFNKLFTVFDKVQRSFSRCRLKLLLLCLDVDLTLVIELMLSLHVPKQCW
jgi:hypothetical protein